MFSPSRTQVMTKFMPGAVFVHDTYGICRVTSVDMDPNVEINPAALSDALFDYLVNWDASMRPGFIEDANQDISRFYSVGIPREVRYEPYPDVFQCNACGRTYRLRQLRESPNVGRCPACGNKTLRQLRYVEAHNCGRMEPLYVPPCKKHGYGHVRFLDTGRFRTSTWRCILCGEAVIQGTRQRPCDCQYSRENQSDRWMKGFVVTDPGLHLVHTIPFLNLRPADIDDILNDTDGRALALARSCGVSTRPVRDVLRQRSRSEETDELNRFVEQLRESGVPKDFLEKELAALRKGQFDAEKILESLDAAYHHTLREVTGRIPRRVVEHAAILDGSDSRDGQAVLQDFRTAGDEHGAALLEEGLALAEQMGLRHMRILGAFPITLCALGYSRIARRPDTSMLVPFPSTEADGRIPLYVLPNVTEAIYFQLSPTKVLRWLKLNGIVETDVPETEPEAWGVLHNRIPGLFHNLRQPNHNDREAVLVRTLLHTISHSLLGSIEWSGYDSESVGEFLFPEVLACVLYANRYQEIKVGGLLTLFERGLGSWLLQSRDTSRSCIYDPLCSDEGGACVGCLHREYGCVQVNSELSRSTLFGGGVPLEGTSESITIKVGFWEEEEAVGRG